MSSTEDREIRAILVELQEEIRRHRLALGDLGAMPPPDPLARVREKQAVNPHLPIGWPVMPPGLVPKLVAYAQKIVRRLLRWYINPIVAQQNEFNAAVTDLLASQQARLDQLSQAAKLSSIAESLTALQHQVEADLETIRLRLQRLENWRRDEMARNEPTPTKGEPAARIDDFLWGALHRSRSQMAARLHDYDDMLTNLLSAADPLAPVLDLGCGRGEFVGHMVALGLPAYGVDINAEALAIGRAEGLDLRHEDALTHLKNLPDNSLRGVTMIQVVEHFEPEALLDLLQWIERKLKPGGLVLAETVNPESIYALVNWYLRDPSHRTPLHNATLRFVMAQAGFHRIETRFLHPVPEKERLQADANVQAPADPAIAALVSQVQHNTALLNRFLYGPQDYAVLAYKPEV